MREHVHDHSHHVDASEFLDDGPNVTLLYRDRRFSMAGGVALSAFKRSTVVPLESRMPLRRDERKDLAHHRLASVQHGIWLAHDAADVHAIHRTHRMGPVQ